jgi:hypothetical protein
MHSGLGLCRKCPSLAWSVVGFLAARLVDVLAVSGIVVAWCYGGLWANAWMMRVCNGMQCLGSERGSSARALPYVGAVAATAAFILLVRGALLYMGYGGGYNK